MLQVRPDEHVMISVLVHTKERKYLQNNNSAFTEKSITACGTLSIVLAIPGDAFVQGEALNGPQHAYYYEKRTGVWNGSSISFSFIKNMRRQISRPSYVCYYEVYNNDNGDEQPLVHRKFVVYTTPTETSLNDTKLKHMSSINSTWSDVLDDFVKEADENSKTMNSGNSMPQPPSAHGNNNHVPSQSSITCNKNGNLEAFCTNCKKKIAFREGLSPTDEIIHYDGMRKRGTWVLHSQRSKTELHKKGQAGVKCNNKLTFISADRSLGREAATSDQYGLPISQHTDNDDLVQNIGEKVSHSWD